MEYLTAALGILVTNLPGIIAEVVLLGLALTRWDQHPRVSTLATSGAALLLLNSLLSGLFGVLPIKLHERGMSPSEMGALLGVVGLARSVLYAVGIGLVVGAVFADRSPNKPA